MIDAEQQKIEIKENKLKDIKDRNWVLERKMGELKTEKSNESIDRLVTKNGKLKENLKNLQKILEENAQKLQILKQEEEELVKKSKKRC